MVDGSVMMKKKNGDIIIIDKNKDKIVLDKDGKVKFKDSYRFKLHYNMSDNIRPIIKDLTRNTINGRVRTFYQNNNSYFLREDGKLYEVLPQNISLLINDDGSKTRYTKDRKEVC